MYNVKAIRYPEYCWESFDHDHDDAVKGMLVIRLNMTRRVLTVISGTSLNIIHCLNISLRPQDIVNGLKIFCPTHTAALKPLLCLLPELKIFSLTRMFKWTSANILFLSELITTKHCCSVGRVYC